MPPVLLPTPQIEVAFFSCGPARTGQSGRQRVQPAVDQAVALASGIAVLRLAEAPHAANRHAAAAPGH